MENLEQLVKQLCNQSEELPWLEFKVDNYNGDMIGKDISALANGAALEEQDRAYFVWGIEDATHEVKGTDYNLQNLKKGNEELENWLRAGLSQNSDFTYHTVTVDGKVVGLMEIKAAVDRPVSFRNVEYVRVGSYTKKLSDYPALQTRLWRRLQTGRFELQTSLGDIELSKALAMIDYGSYFTLTSMTQPSSSEEIAKYLVGDRILVHQMNGLYSVTNMGALLYARRLSEFSSVSRKAIRIIQYEGKNRLNILKEEIDDRGYALGLDDVLRYIEALLPTREVFDGAVRKKQTVYPSAAIKEIVSNALIHQDLAVTGAGPLVEIFADRIEVTNPGIPLVDIRRIVDNPPRSRNESMAALMRRMDMCEEAGSGWDRIVISCELKPVPTPEIILYEESTKVIMSEAKTFAQMTREERLWNCYMHCCVLFVQNESMSNASLRTRFGLSASSAGSISRLIKDAVDEKMIKPVDPNTSNRYMKYIPYWG